MGAVKTLPNMRVAIARAMKRDVPYDPFYVSKQWKELRRQVLVRDLWRCGYCGENGKMVDHIMPRRQGGSDSPDNLVCVCRRCNELCGNRSFYDFADKKEWIRERI